MKGTADWIDGKDEGINEATERAAKICEEMAEEALSESRRHSAGSDFSLYWVTRSDAFNDAAARIRGRG